MNDPWSIGINNDGELEMGGYDGFVEPTCCECHEPIRWVLDMMSMKRQSGGKFTMAHARCVWKPEGFRKQAAIAERSKT